MSSPLPGGSYDPITGITLPDSSNPIPLPAKSDGTPNFGVLDKTNSSGGYKVWDIPTELNQALAISNGKLWFDTGSKKTVAYSEEPHNSAYDEQVPEAARKAASSKFVDINHYDIMRKPEQIMAQFYAMSFNDPQRFMALQKALASGPWGTVHLNGNFDHDTEVALGNAMLQYVKGAVGAGVAISFTDYLLTMGARAQALGGDGTSLGTGNGSTRAPFQANLDDPIALRDAAQKAAQQALGQGLSPDQLNAFVAHFQAAQTAAEQANYNGKGTVTTPDPVAEAMQFAQQSNPQEYKQNQRQSFMDTLVNMFAPSGSQRPTMTPTPAAG